MTADEFIEVVYERAYLAVPGLVERTIMRPPGQIPSPRLVALQPWWSRAAAEDRRALEDVLLLAADYAIHNVMCFLDNVDLVDSDTEDPSEEAIQLLELCVRRGSLVRPLDVKGEEFHALWQVRRDEGPVIRSAPDGEYPL